ncbi:transglycosylase domain-containing protein [Caldisericum exile]|uniref:Penicillin-binding protein n=1 Tax=Caldisericum exile (strain DSM 21853 / NBRC 104410 / AZM16c01) TaxID=511051 RepID=A0A7U6JEX9_CALEA|nr:transglycosylase domain-containing protein [Caldisericum exile]BAL81201.1 putative penicillin-binding protein [Caldisericum exile AZM16c01]
MEEMNKNKKKKRSILKAIIVTLIVFVLIIGLIGGTVFAIYINKAKQGLPNIDIYTFSPDQASQIFDYKGNLITNVYATENRIYVKLSEISPIAIKAVLAQEDKRFYEHGALDYKGILRAIYVAIISRGRTIEGASTITQQLARTMFLTQERTIDRKIKEALLATELEKRFTKDQILEMYLNQVYFGSGAYGIEQASLTYFGKHAKDLDLAEGAMLAGIIQAPSEYNPYANFDYAKTAQKEVLDKMLSYKMISQDEYNKAINEEIKLTNKPVEKDNMGYVIDYVKDFVASKFGSTMLYAGGLKIYTTVIPELQKAATQAIDEVLNKAENDNIFPKGKKDSKGVIQPQAALTAINANTGAILAMVGGRDYDNTKYNRTVALKQPGSSFKIFDYTSAILYGSITPSSIILSENYTIDNWTPHEWEGKYFGYLSVREALNQSSNVCAVKTALSVGLERVIFTARKFGITTPLNPYPSIAIGSFEIKQLEMANAYATLGNGGIYHEPYIVTKILSSDGRVLYEHQDQSYRAIPEDVAYIMNNLFSYVMAHKSNAKISGLPSAGKTGSTDNWRDAWFDGYTPNISVSVWVGPDSDEITFPDVMNAGARFPAMIWRKFMLVAMNYFPKNDFAKPQNITFKNAYDDTGYLTDKPSDGKTIIKYAYHNGFLPGTDIRDLGFVVVRVVKDSGLLAPPTCPLDLTEERVFIKGTEPTQYDPRYETVTQTLSISTDKDTYKVGEPINISVDASQFDLSNKTLNLIIDNLPVANLTNEQNGFYNYSILALRTGDMKIEAYLKDSNGNVVAYGEKIITINP